MRAEDRKLLEKAKRGDMEAFAALFEPLRALVHAVAFRMVGVDDADDVTMETFLKAWQAIPRFRGGSSLRTWVCRIARNSSVDIIRRRKHRGELECDSEGAPAWGDIADDAAADPSASIIRDETIDRVQLALGQLSAEHRQAVLLRYVDELSYSEIGAATGSSIGTVMSRLYYAKRKLHTLLRGI